MRQIGHFSVLTHQIFFTLRTNTMSPSDRINALYRLAGGGIVHTSDGTCPSGMTRCDPSKQACPEGDEGLEIRTIDGALCRDAKQVEQMDSKMRTALTTGVRELMRQMVILVDLNAALDDIMQKDAEGAAQILDRATAKLQKNAPALRPESAPVDMSDLPSFTPDVKDGELLETGEQAQERETAEGLATQPVEESKQFLERQGASDGEPESAVQAEPEYSGIPTEDLGQDTGDDFGLYSSGQ